MKTQKQLGIWMDHSIAKLIDIHSKKINRTIASNFSFNTKEEALTRSENLMHNKRQQMNEAYFKEIGSTILLYDDVLIFGPTNARLELHNYLNKDLHFKDINIETESVDNMTDNQQDAFVKRHFDK